MFNKTTEIDSYYQQGTEVKVLQNKDGSKNISLRTSILNMVVNLQIVNDTVEYSVIDSNKGRMKFMIPLTIHQKIFNETLI